MDGRCGKPCTRHQEAGGLALNLIFLNRFFYPDHSATSQMLSDLAFDLAAKGARVTVITSRQRYDAPGVVLPAAEMVSGVQIRRVWTSRFGRQNLLGRSIDYVSFYVTAAWALFRLADRGAVVISKTDPPMLSVIANPIARFRGAQAVNWLQDVFPEVAEALGVGSNAISRMGFALLRRLRNRSLRRASMNVVIGDRMADLLTAIGVAQSQICVIPNWADGKVLNPVAPENNSLRKSWGLSGNFVVGYSGNLGRAHEYETLLVAIKDLEHTSNGEKPIAWLFIGGGALFETFKREVENLNLTSVRFEPYQPREKLAESLSASDVHLVSLRPELEGLIVPSKFYGVAAVGRSTIFIGSNDGEIARVLARAKCGDTVAMGNGMALAQTVLAFASNPATCTQMGQNARRVFEREFDMAIAMERWQQLLRELLGPDALHSAVPETLVVQRVASRIE